MSLVAALQRLAGRWCSRSHDYALEGVEEEDAVSTLQAYQRQIAGTSTEDALRTVVREELARHDEERAKGSKGTRSRTQQHPAAQSPSTELTKAKA
ncbi:hypothetical protein WJX72_003353 [[Myrmecia] bisecta]|uniref:Uncharacterized protein n=1 Tax=[Myrmecia] bisecta TaxID=41462 RepID=A0AAW1P684_9CHLO